MQRRASLAVLRRWIGFAEDQTLQYAVGTGARRLHQRRDAVTVTHVDRRRGVDEHLHDFAMAMQCGDVQCTAAKLVDRMHVGTRLQQPLAQLGMILGCTGGGDQRRR
jgi:hypothetical protein